MATKPAGDLQPGDLFLYLGRTHRVSGQPIKHGDGRTTVKSILPGGDHDEMTLFEGVRLQLATD